MRLKFIVLTCVLTTAAAIEVHQFEAGTNASVTFHQQLHENSSAECEVFSLNEARPFYKNHHIDESALQPNQRGRFIISTERRGENFTLNLHIYNIQEEDEGVYILSMKETIGGHSTTHILDAYIEVLLTLGKVVCDVRDSSYTSNYHEVSCHATLGSDNKGFVLCYQNFEKAPTTGAVERSSDFIRASFWMHRDSSIFCCSFKSDEEIHQESCTDFVYHPDHVHNEATSVKPSDTTIRDRLLFITPTSSLPKDETASINNGHSSKPILTKIQNNIIISFGLVVFLVTAMIIILIFVVIIFLFYMIRLSIIPYKACKRVLNEDIEENNDDNNEGNAAPLTHEMKTLLDYGTNMINCRDSGNASEEMPEV